MIRFTDLVLLLASFSFIPEKNPAAHPLQAIATASASASANQLRLFEELPGQRNAGIAKSVTASAPASKSKSKSAKDLPVHIPNPWVQPPKATKYNPEDPEPGTHTLNLSLTAFATCAISITAYLARAAANVKQSRRQAELEPLVGDSDMSRRTALASMAAAASASNSFFISPPPAEAISGVSVYKDTREGYQFAYPAGWQNVQVDGQAVVLKDTIEPLETASLNIYPTERESLRDIGTPEEVANILFKQTLSAPGALGKLLKFGERSDKEGHLYYTFEFVSKTNKYERHAITTVAINQGKFYTLTSGSSEKRWDKMKERLRVINDSFTLYY